MKKLAFTWAIVAGLAGCANQEWFEPYPQDWFLAATQETIDGDATTIEMFEAWTTNDPACIRNDIARGVADLLLEGDDRETVDVCLFNNEEDAKVDLSTIPTS